ncbi:M15 family metallopeptidase [Actinotalea sp. BY-33]|uniref:M15 family metallopeptidase n=1 Tax=Actinotalea soli TaxID=2819234 RepID=A0A939RV62_9CELL|nr:M15 family metallopeptidase [Actinotalea soli]MBO1751298.1 M15 family metallopeptidase [Actinotalea soli]
MEAIAGITSRIAQIQSQIATISAPTVRGAPVLGTVSTATTSSSAGSFGAALEKAVATQNNVITHATGATGVAATAGAAGTSTTGRVDEKGIPLELKQYGNGKIPDEALSQIAGSGHKLWSPAARSYEALQAAAQRDGVTIGMTDSYRTYASQVDLVQRKGLYSQGGLAAVPGTSDHGWGIAVDLRLDAKAQAWMRANAKDYGFVEDVPREPWHWAFKPHKV